jgi:nucleoside-diphosphate-sugar epimerase
VRGEKTHSSEALSRKPLGILLAPVSSLSSIMTNCTYRTLDSSGFRHQPYHRSLQFGPKPAEQSMAKHVLVAGGAGFIGSHLVDRLLERDDLSSIDVVDNLWTGSIQNIAHISDARFGFFECDIESFRHRSRPDGFYDEVYHLASPASPCRYMREPARTISANVSGAFRLSKLVKADGLFCFTSTSEVYGDPLVSPQPESYRGFVDCTGPRAAYDESKRCTEAFLFEMHRVHGLRVRVARLFNVFGPRTRPDDGRAISNFIAQALSNRRLTVYGDGKQSRSWGYVDDIVDGLARFFWLQNESFVGPLNIGNDREISVIEVARFMQTLFPSLLIEHHPPVPQDPTNRRPDLTLANEILPGWSCQVPYEEGIRSTISWMSALLKADSLAEAPAPDRQVRARRL